MDVPDREHSGISFHLNRRDNAPMKGDQTQVVLHIKGVDVPCGWADSIKEAHDKADAYVAKNHPGKTVG